MKQILNRVHTLTKQKRQNAQCSAGHLPKLLRRTSRATDNHKLQNCNDIPENQSYQSDTSDGVLSDVFLHQNVYQSSTVSLRGIVWIFQSPLFSNVSLITLSFKTVKKNWKTFKSFWWSILQSNRFFPLRTNQCRQTVFYSTGTAGCTNEGNFGTYGAQYLL